MRERRVQKPVVIFHTSDLHGVLREGAAEKLGALKRAHPGSLLLDAGDALRAGNLGFSPAGEPILRRMAEVGYDAMAMGNRESHPLRAALAQKLKDATFPVLSANLVAKARRLAERGTAVSRADAQRPEDRHLRPHHSRLHGPSRGGRG